MSVSKNKIQNLQDKFLNESKNNNELIEINLVNGLVLKCKIINYDNFSLHIIHNNLYSLLYKHSIAYITKLKKNKK